MDGVVVTHEGQRAFRLLIGQRDTGLPSHRSTWHPAQGGRPPVIIPCGASPSERARLLWRQGERPVRQQTGSEQDEAMMGMLIDMAAWR